MTGTTISYCSPPSPTSPSIPGSGAAGGGGGGGGGAGAIMVSFTVSFLWAAFRFSRVSLVFESL